MHKSPSAQAFVFCALPKRKNCLFLFTVLCHGFLASCYQPVSRSQRLHTGSAQPPGKQHKFPLGNLEGMHFLLEICVFYQAVVRFLCEFIGCDWLACNTRTGNDDKMRSFAVEICIQGFIFERFEKRKLVRKFAVGNREPLEYMNPFVSARAFFFNDFLKEICAHFLELASRLGSAHISFRK